MFSQNEGKIIDLLAKGPNTTRDVFDTLRQAMTEQGFYKCVRRLVKGEVITKEGLTVRLSQNYLRKKEDELLQMRKSYDVRSIDSVFSSLSEGDFIQISAYTIQQLDQILLDHLFFTLSVEGISSVVLYSSPEVFPAVRPTQSKEFLDFFAGHKGKLFVALTDTHQPKHKEVKKMFCYENTIYEWNVKKPITPKADLFQVCGDFVFLVKLGKKTKKNVQEFLKSNDSRQFFDIREKHSIKIIRSKSMANKIKLSLLKQVYLPSKFAKMELLNQKL